ncbi:dihydrolipoamide acetyltransferase family protein [Amycolatopsis viridis]|uniref:Dihydrolipoamide acetyltransferase component of pyruvate dehydrogenase complex n=1 Tax=Amycolatopsis viridis TaxID=185678 RepID=A0ABX0T2W0_9PSEU|nr:dihydrolipoamide acetyltransferase family protein [Amycolatopsis viridis]NIH82244.1 pyruvate dehydrogenase E2 component (dihydrolipoamide acetyltransferase) [Amycolatopsis viridis]
MAELLPVPEVAAGATEVVVAEWLVKVGDEFAAGDLIAVIETEKAVVEMEAEKGATLLRALVAPGSTVDVGAPMALLGSADELTEDLDAVLAELGVTGAGTAEPVAAVPATASATEAASQGPSAGTTDAAPGSRTFISPIARKLLREAGLSPDGVTGTGPHGRIRRRDVEHLVAAAASQAPAAPATPAAPTAPSVPSVPSVPSTPTAPSAPAAAAVTGWTDVEHTRLRRAIARRLTQSKQEIPHFYVKRTAVLDELLALRARLNDAAPTKISVNDFLIRAVAVAHTRVPDANVIWTDDALRHFDGVDISVAIASARGLVTPVLRGVEKSSLSAISAQVKTYVEQADAGRLQQQDLEGGSISISNLGMYGVEEFSAIINPPQSAILAVGAGRPTPVVVGDEVTVRTAVQLVLSVDHRAIDGALAAQWMDALVTAIENPLSLVV